MYGKRKREKLRKVFLFFFSTSCNARVFRFLSFRTMGFCRRIFYPSRQAWYIIRTCAVYHQLAQRVVYHHASACIFCRLDDIQHFVLVIYNSYGIDDIHGFAVMGTRGFKSVTKPAKIFFTVTSLKRLASADVFFFFPSNLLFLIFPEIFAHNKTKYFSFGVLSWKY